MLDSQAYCPQSHGRDEINPYAPRLTHVSDRLGGFWKLGCVKWGV